MSDLQRQHGERKACEACAKAKAKCNLPTSNLAGDVKCDRCIRLKKTCVPQAPTTKKRKPAKPNTSRGLQMEQKLDSIVNLLAARENGTEVTPQIPQETVDNPLPHLFTNRWKKTPVTGKVSHLWRPDSSVTGTAAEEIDYAAFPLPNVKLSYEEMETLVDSWRPQLADHFPFAALYEGQSTRYVLVEMPFLATAISCAALYGDLPRQIDLAQSLIKEISERMLLQGEKSLDLLLGILVLIAWYHWHVFCNPQVSNLHHLAAALLVDLGLNRPPDRLHAQKFQLFGLHFIHGPNAHQNLRSMSERRALVGCYYMSNVIWSTFKKLNSTPWSDHVEEALHALLEAKELPSDSLLVYLAKAQRLLESVELGLGLQNPQSGSVESAAHVILFVSSFTQDMRQLHADMPEHVRENISIKLVLHEIEATIYDIAFQHLNVLASQQKDDPKTRSITRLEYCRASLIACKKFSETLLRVRPGHYYRHSFHTWARMCRILMVIARIEQTENLRQVECELGTIIDFSSLVERFAYNYEQAEASAKEEGLPLGNNHLFRRWAFRLRTFKEVNERVNDPEGLATAAANATFPGDDPWVPPDAYTSSSGRTPAGDEVLDLQPFESPQETWGKNLVDYNAAQPQCPMQ